MLISTSHQFIFVHVPKTAGTSITEVLEPYADRVNKTFSGQVARRMHLPGTPGKAFFRTHDTVKDLIARLGRQTFASFTSFAVVRDPFDHARSHYDYLRRHKNVRLRRHFEDMRFAAYLDFRLSNRQPLGIPKFASIKDQASFLVDNAGRLSVDRILAFERLASELPLLLSDLGLDAVELPHRRARPDGSNLDRNSFPDECVAKIQALYQRDFELFGYSSAGPRP